MRALRPDSAVFVPDGVSEEVALRRTTHLAIGAHPDDVPLMAQHGILECFASEDRWFTAVTVTDGAGSPRTAAYADHTDVEMRQVRAHEETKAAVIGEYSAAVLLGHSSAAVKTAPAKQIVDELAELVTVSQPEVVYTHNPADKHDTHVAVALRTIDALRLVPESRRPTAVYGCEVWRDLDWLPDADKVTFDVSQRQNLARALMGVYDSQVSGGKRYDLAVAGRRLAHATFSASHEVDLAEALTYAIDLTPLIRDPALDIATFVVDHLTRLAREISTRITTLEGGDG